MITVVQVDVVGLEVDAVVRPVRSDLAPVSALSRDLGVAAGDVVEERLLRLGSLPLGGAAMTPAGDLACDFLIHVVVMSEDEAQTSSSVQKALQNALRRAADLGIDSLALPPLGLGVGLTEPEVSARALVDILFDHLEDGRPPLNLMIVVPSEYEVELFTHLVAEATRERSLD